MTYLLLISTHWRILHTLAMEGNALGWSMALFLLVRRRSGYTRVDRVRFTAEEFAAAPSLSVLVPACNEAETIERAMRSLMALHYPDMEIIAVDDRSTDGTGEILDRLAEECGRLRVIHLKELPPHWLGKNHALHVAGEAANGKWLLFTDADVIFSPDSLLRAVCYSEKKQLDHLVLTPVCDTHGFWEKLFVSYFGLMFSFRTRIWSVGNRSSSAYIGVGAFNLVRASAYRSFGGHTSMPMEVIDDMKLGKQIKTHGFQQAVAQGNGLISVRWVVGLSGVWNSLMKNAFAGFEFRISAVIVGLILLVLSTLYPLVGLLAPVPEAQRAALITLVAMMCGAASIRRTTGANAAYGLAYPLAALLLIGIIVRAVYLVYRHNGVVWRGTTYPLNELREGVI